jgi:hypothetical protein
MPKKGPRSALPTLSWRPPSNVTESRRGPTFSGFGSKISNGRVIYRGRGPRRARGRRRRRSALSSGAPGVGDPGGLFGLGRSSACLPSGGAKPDVFFFSVGTDTGTVCFGGLSNGFAETGFGIGFFAAAGGPFCFGVGFFGGDPIIGATDRVGLFVSLTSSTRRSGLLRARGNASGVTFAVVCAGFGRERDGPEAALPPRALRTRYRRRQRKVSQPKMSATVRPPATIPPATARNMVSPDPLTGCS